MNVAFIGLGNMGRPMARNLLAAGFALRAWNRTPGKAPEGAVEMGTPREAARFAQVVVTMLADDAAVEAVTLGESGLKSGLRKGGIHVGMSTISTQLSARLADAHRAAGQSFLAAPVFGRPDAAEKKLLWILPGGDDAAIAECTPLFAALGQGTFPIGTAPQASLAKLTGNFILASLIETFGEAFALAEKGSVDTPKLAETLATVLFANAPIPKGYATRIAATQFVPAGFSLPLGLKDVKLALQAGEELRVPMPLGSLVRDHLLAALAKGREGFDWGGMASVIREAAGLPPVRK